MTDPVAQKAPPKSGVVAYLQIDGAVKVAEFYKKAFGAEVAAMMPPDDKGRSMHIHLYLNGGSLMLGDFYPEHGHNPVPPSGFTITLSVTDIDKTFQQAVDAGCTVTMPVQDMFWGDRYGSVSDPFGVHWAMNQAGS